MNSIYTNEIKTAVDVANEASTPFAKRLWSEDNKIVKKGMSTDELMADYQLIIDRTSGVSYHLRTVREIKTFWEDDYSKRRAPRDAPEDDEPACHREAA